MIEGREVAGVAFGLDSYTGAINLVPPPGSRGWRLQLSKLCGTGSRGFLVSDWSAQLHGQRFPGRDLPQLSLCSWRLFFSVLFELSFSCSIHANSGYSWNQWPPALLPGFSLVLILGMILRPACCRSVALLHEGIWNITHRASYSHHQSCVE